MKTVQEIQQAIDRLTSDERGRIAAWIRELESADYSVAEPPTAYNVIPDRRWSVEEYLQLESDGQLRHEYIDGAIHAMSGASDSHNTIAGNLFTALRTRLKGRPCRVYISDFKVRLKISDKDIFYYPDVLVSCNPIGIERYYLDSPTLVAEVLSPSTAAIDQREKLMNYRQAPTLEEYCLIAQDTHRVTVYRRANDWQAQTFSLPDAAVELRSVGQTLTLSEIYADVRW